MNKILLLSIGFLVAIAAAAAGLILAKERRPDIVVYINEQPVDEREFALYMQDQIAGVAAYYYRKYGVEADRDFWDRDFDGEIPRETLKTRMMTELVRAKVVQIIARQQHIVTDIGYSTFQRQMKEENRRREKAVNAGEAIYGPVRYDEKQFLSDYLGKMNEKLQEVLTDRMFRVSEEQLMARYETLKDTFFHQGYEIRTEQVWVESYEDKQAATEALQAIRERARSGEQLQLAAEEEQKNRPSLAIVYREQLLGNRNTSKDDQRSSRLEEIAAQYDAGEMSDIVELDQAIGFIGIQSKKNLGYRPYADARGAVLRRYMSEQYASYIDRQTQEAKVTFVEGAYEALVPAHLINI